MPPEAPIAMAAQWGPLAIAFVLMAQVALKLADRKTKPDQAQEHARAQVNAERIASIKESNGRIESELQQARLVSAEYRADMIQQQAQVNHTLTSLNSAVGQLAKSQTRIESKLQPIADDVSELRSKV